MLPLNNVAPRINPLASSRGVAGGPTIGTSMAGSAGPGGAANSMVFGARPYNFGPTNLAGGTGAVAQQKPPVNPTNATPSPANGPAVDTNNGWNINTQSYGTGNNNVAPPTSQGGLPPGSIGYNAFGQALNPNITAGTNAEVANNEQNPNAWTGQGSNNPGGYNYDLNYNLMAQTYGKQFNPQEFSNYWNALTNGGTGYNANAASNQASFFGGQPTSPQVLASQTGAIGGPNTQQGQFGSQQSPTPTQFNPTPSQQQPPTQPQQPQGGTLMGGYNAWGNPLTYGNTGNPYAYMTGQQSNGFTGPNPTMVNPGFYGGSPSMMQMLQSNNNGQGMQILNPNTGKPMGYAQGFGPQYGALQNPMYGGYGSINGLAGLYNNNYGYQNPFANYNMSY